MKDLPEIERIAKKTISLKAPAYIDDQAMLEKVIDDMVSADMRYNPSRSSQRTWRIAQAGFAILNYLRKDKYRHKKELVVEPEYEDSTKADLFHSDIYNYMVKVLGEQNAGILHSYYIEGFTMEEIAKDLGISKQGVHQRIAKHTERLRNKKFENILRGLS